MKLSLIALTAGLTILSTQQTAFAAHNPAKRFHKLDRNSDGRLSLDEFRAGAKNPAKAEKHFQKLDTNNDGFISADELAARARK